MNWADWAIVAILSISVLISLIRGFVKEAMSLVVWISAVLVAMLFYQRLAPWLVDLISTPSLRLLVAWLILFVGVLIIGGLINYLLGKLVLATGLSGTDRLLGVIFGAGRGVVVVLIALILAPNVLPVDQDLWWHESLLIPEFLRFEGWARETAATISDLVSEFFDRFL